jgi:type IV secretory pathway VirB6-like protein
MRQVTVTANSSGVTTPVVLDQYLTPFQVTYSKTGSGTVQVTATDPYPISNGNYVEATYTWITAPNTAPNTATFLAQPYRAIRLSGAAEGDTLTVIQSGVK